MNAPEAGALWGGRFRRPTFPSLRRLNDSLSFDRELVAEDVAASSAWATALAAAGVLTAAEERAITKGLRAVAAQAEREGVPESGFEDVHSYVEASLARRVGALAGKLSSGRSRNDLVATDLRLYLKCALGEARRQTLDLAEALAQRGLAEAATPMPGYTHLQRALPVTFGHWCLAYVEMLLRDAQRFSEAHARADECPLGAGALAGTPVAVDRGSLARTLGFARASANSLDSVSDRDGAAEYLFVGTLELVHLSRMAEDLILFSSSEFGFVELPDELSTGSSRMPQKKNPDLFELVRGHAGRAIGNLAGLLAILKGLPLSYDKDLQLDKEPIFHLRAVLDTALPSLSSLVAGLRIDRERMRVAACDDRLLATEVADAMAARGVPFRRAHEIVGRRIARAEAAGVAFSALPPADGVTTSDLAAMSLSRSLSRRRSFGGTAPARVRLAARAAMRRIARMRRDP